jgi:REase_DpnII-MboI
MTSDRSPKQPGTSKRQAAVNERGADKRTADQKIKLEELIELVKQTAQAKGWATHVTAKDTKNFRYATVDVSRHASNTAQQITGTFEITCAERVKITHHSTSFYSWGLSDLYDAVGNEFWKLPWIQKAEKKPENYTSDITLIERLLRRFHRSVRQLKHRHADRPSIQIRDEYDVQDLLHVFLRGLFDDVRSEEYAPSYAGGASRMDFLLKSEQIVLEIKLANASLRDKQIGEQLIVDIQRYQSHPDCKRLICFVYDPDGNIRNPTGLESDLSRIHNELEVKVIVVSP